MDDLESRTRSLIRDHVRNTAIERNADPIVPLSGERDSLIDLVFPREMPTVVIDANIVRNEFSYLTRQKATRTTLVNAANARLIRVFVHEHVVNEVHEHLEDWARQLSTDVSRLRAWWCEDYRPLLRMIPASLELWDLLTSDERSRIATLRTRDSDDVPSAALSIVLGAYYLSEDGAAVEAVSGAPYDRNAAAKWVSTLKAGSSSGEVMRLKAAAIIVPVALTYSLSETIRETWKAAPALVVTIGVLGLGATALCIRRIDYDTLRAVGSLAVDGMIVLKEFVSAEGEFYRLFRAATPRVPALVELPLHLERKAALQRAALQAASRLRRTSLSATELSAHLRNAGFDRGEQSVRAVLRHSGAFRLVSRGRWAPGFQLPGYPDGEE